MSRIPEKTIATPTTHYGSGKAATRHFRVQRLSGMANVVFTIFLVAIVVGLARSAPADAIAMLRHPIVAILLALLFVNVPVHMRIGMMEVIEDYVHEPALNRLCLTLNNAFAVAVGVIGVVSVAKLAIWG